MKKVICFFICVCFMMQSVAVFAEGNTDLGLNAKSAILMEESTGNILYESNPDERLPIASVTKVMTMLLIMEAVDSGKISLDDMVTVSENAMSYGGSTMFLETGEQLTVNDMLKGIAVASANDGCVAMAEHLDEDDHYSSARDVAIMSRELMKHETIFNYTSIWMDTLRGGKFQLANTNKLIRFYDGANGLKTGSTSKALCCLSAAAKRNDMQLIAVVLGAPTSAERFASAKSLLDYGFANYAVNTQITAGDEVQKIAVEKGVDKEVDVVAGDSCSTLVKKGQEDNITKEIKIDETITAPIEAGQKIGTMTISRDGEVIADIDLNASSAVEKKGIGLIIKDFFATIFFGSNNDTEENSEI